MLFSTPSFVLLALFASALAIPMPGPAATQPFTLSNGQKAIQENAGFAALSPNSPCTNGQDACVQGKFAQCSGGKFSLTSCAGGTICASLPLVNKAGTSITCTTEADKNARIAATGATGTGTAGHASTPAAAPSAAAVLASSPAPGAKPFTLQNGKDAQKLNAQFSTLTASSPCTAGQEACVNNQFAQCVAGKFVLTSCGTGLQCAALPLVNKAGTSITCTTQAEALARISATNAGNSLTGA